MQAAQCPVCYHPLEVIDVAPCWECGHLAEEIEHAQDGKHTYAEVRKFGTLMIVLCDFCQVDFGSFDPAFFGLPRSTDIGYKKAEFIRQVEPVYIGKDKYCPQCRARLKFLEFIGQARELYESGKAPDKNIA